MSMKDKSDIICFCFGYSKEDILNDLKDNGRSLILEQIQLSKKDDGCDCANKNPKGR